MFFSSANPATSSQNLQSQLAREFNNSVLRASTGPNAIPISINRSNGGERIGQQQFMRTTYVNQAPAPQMTHRVIRRSPSEGTHAFGIDALKRSLHQQRESAMDGETASIQGDVLRASTHRYVSTGSLATSGIRQGPMTPARGISNSQAISTSSVRSPSAQVLVNPDMKASISSRVSHETQTVHMHEPRVVSINRMAAVEKSVKNLEPVLIEVRRAENVTSTETVNIKSMLVDSYKRIVLMGMENDRLNQKVAQYEYLIAEFRAKITSLEIQISDSESYRTEFARFKSRAESLEIKINELLTERSSFLSEIELLRNDTSRSAQWLSEIDLLKRQLNESQDKISMLATENDRLHSIKNEMHVQHQQEISELKRQITMLASENERLHDLRSQNAKLQTELTNHRNEITMLVTENERLHTIKSELLRYQTELKTANDRLSAQNLELERLRTDFKNLQSENSRLLRDIEQIPVLQADNRQLSHELIDFRNKLSQLAAEHDRLQDALSRAERDNGQLQSKLESTRVEYERKLREREDSHRALQETYDALRLQFDQLTSDMRNLEQELHRLTQEFTIVVNENEQLKSEIKQLDEILQSRDLEKDELENRIRLLEEELRKWPDIQELKNQIASLRSETSEQKLVIQRLSSEATAKDNKIRELEARLQAAANEAREYRTLYEEAKKELQIRVAAIHELERELRAAQDAFRRADEELHQIQNAYALIERAKRDLDEELRRLRADLERSQNENRALRGRPLLSRTNKHQRHPHPQTRV